jgi:hypothetical protein
LGCDLDLSIGQIPPTSFIVSAEGSSIIESDLKSIMIPQEIMGIYLVAVEKLKKKLIGISLNDHLWSLKSWDQNVRCIVKFWCGKCCKEFEGVNGDHSKFFINNLFGNFKKSHIMSFVHVQNWCQRKGVNFFVHPQFVVPKGETILLTNEDHKRVVIEGIRIIKFINAPFAIDEKPFILVGDLESSKLKSFWYKIRCTFCNDFFQLCPPKKNLEGNLKNYMEKTKHAKVIEDVLSKKSYVASTLLIG